MDIYKLLRVFWDYTFENTGKIKPNHIAVYMFAIEHCNRLGWKKNFGFPTTMVMDAVSIKSYSVYKTIFDDLVDFGFFDVIQYSKNQYSSNIIALKENYKANYKALDKAITKHTSKQPISNSQSTHQSNSSIDIHNTIIPNTDIQKNKFDFRKSLFDLVQDEQLVNDFLIVRKNKKSSNTKTAFDGLVKKITQANVSVKDAIKICVEKSWAGFDGEWLAKSGITIKSGNNEPNIEFYEGKQVYESNGRRYILKGESVKYIYPKEPNMEGWTEREIYNYRTCDRFNDTWAERYKNARDNQMNTTEAEKRGIYKYFYDQETLRFKIADHTNVRTS